MSGRLVAGGLVVFALIFGAALWYFQTRAFYERVTDRGAIEVAGTRVPVTDYRGIDADTSPIKLRGCFRVDPAAVSHAPEAPAPEPLVAPPWFDCFDAAAIARDLQAGRATAYLAGDETPEGAAGYVIHRIIAVYPDGRGYLWRQLTE